MVEILKTLAPDEFRSLEKFAASPYFSVGRDLTHFLRILKTFYPDFSHKNFTHEYVYSKLYPGKTEPGKVQQTIKTLSSQLIYGCKEFFRQIEFEKDTDAKNIYLLDQLRARKLYREFDKEYRVSVERRKNSHNGGVNDFINEYFLDSAFRDYSLDKDDFMNAFEYTLSADENIVADALMMSFMIEDTKNISTGYNLPLRYTLMNNLIECLDTDKLLFEMKKNNDRFYSYVVIFYLIHKMNKHKDKREYFYELKNLLIEQRDLFGQSENYIFWNMLLSYCSNNGLRRKEFTDIYEHIIENNIYKKPDEDFHIVLFRNIITTTSETGNFKWLENFIEKYTPELHIDHRENMYNYSHAHVNFAKRNFEQALKYLGRVSYDLFLFKIDVRILLLKIYYELSYVEQAYSLIDSTLHFLKNTSEFSEDRKIQYRTFVLNYKEIFKLRLSRKIEQHSLTFLEKKIGSELTKNAGQIEWLLMKIEELRVSDLNVR